MAAFWNRLTNLYWRWTHVDGRRINPEVYKNILYENIWRTTSKKGQELHHAARQRSKHSTEHMASSQFKEAGGNPGKANQKESQQSGEVSDLIQLLQTRDLVPNIKFDLIYNYQFKYFCLPETWVIWHIRWYVVCCLMRLNVPGES